MSRCSLTPYDCIIEHLCPRLDGRPGKDRWTMRCPAHDDRTRSLSVSVGSKGARIVFTCMARCTPEKVHAAMLAAGVSAGCVPWRHLSERAELAELRQRVAQLEDEQALREKWLLSGMHPVELAIRAAMQMWPHLDQRAAAMQAGISQATFYRHRIRDDDI